MKYIRLILVVMLLGSQVAYAQTDVKIRKSEFRTKKPGVDEAWKHLLTGIDYYDAGGVWYNEAYNEFLQASVYNSANPELNYKTGVSALLSDRKDEAAGFFLKALSLKKDVAPDILYLTGCALQYAGKYNDAIDKFTAYLGSPLKKKQEAIALARQKLLECNSAIAVTKDTLRISITNAGQNINSDADDYSEIISSDGKTMYFASRRQLPVSGKRHPDTKYDENILVSHLINGTWIPAISAGKSLTTRYCEAPLDIDKNNSRLIVYSGYKDKGDIMMSVAKKGNWKSPEELPYKINSRYSESSFTVSPAGDEIYFVSDRPRDGIGGKDIYFIKKLNDKKWSKPQNAGQNINTIYDEESVRFSKTGDTLWFSSKGHNTVGGYDIFYTYRVKGGAWDSVRNVGYPVNTPWDEVFYYPSPVDDSLFYFVSDRSGGQGGSDIYEGRIMPPVKIVLPPAPPKHDTVLVRDTVIIVKQLPPAPVVPEVKTEEPVYLTGLIRDAETGGALIAKIDLLDIGGSTVLSSVASSDVDGGYKLKLPAKKSFMVDIRATGYLSDLKRIDVPENWSKNSYTLNIELIKIKVGKKVVLNNILFETGKAVLTKSSYMELDRLLNIMNDDEAMKIEISGHTDNTGSAQLNTNLSQLRAKAVVDYLVQKGISKDRMTFKGYGSTQPVADNATPAGRTKNRRVEFKILEF